MESYVSAAWSSVREVTQFDSLLSYACAEQLIAFMTSGETSSVHFFI